VVPGIHYDGPADVRLDRLCRVLAHAGALVAVPFLDDAMQLRVTPRAVDQTVAAWDLLRAQPDLPRGVRPALFSISFGSLPAIRLAAARHHEVGNLVLFGGYADPRRTLRFCLTGEVEGRVIARDPRNHAVLFGSLLDRLEPPPRDPQRLQAAWLAFARATWGQPGMRDEAATAAVARRMVADGAVERADAALFLAGCGVGEGSEAPVLPLLEGDVTGWMDPRDDLAQVRCPVDVVHGAQDDVIPVEEAEALVEVARRAAARFGQRPPRLWRTGWYGHTGQGATTDRVAGALREVRTLAGVLQVMASMGGVGVSPPARR
jgi:pimeloyl-ACP methyl ester carboxylesterase